MDQLKHFIKDKYSKNYTCPHCKRDLGRTTIDIDEYDLMKSHIGTCPGKAATAYRKARDEEGDGDY